MARFFLFLISFCVGLAVVSSVQAYFYGLLAMKNPATNKVVILVADIHEQADKDFIKKQARDFRDVTVALQKRGPQDSVYVIAEDQSDFLTKQTQEVYTVQSPINYITTRSRAAGVPAVNVEFRDGSSTQDTTDALQKIRENTKDTALIGRIENYYKHQIKNKLSYEALYLDVAIVNALRASNAQYTFIVAGANHIGSVSKILYQDGYTEVVMQLGQQVTGCYKELLYCFNKLEAIGLFTGGTAPEPIMSLKDAVLESLDTLEDTKKL